MDAQTFRHPWHEMLRLQREMEHIFSGLTPRWRWPAVPEYPPIAISRGENTLTVESICPGVEPTTLDVSLVGGALTIHCERKPPADVSEERYLRRERPVGVFTRTIDLGDRFDPERTEAKYRHGILRRATPGTTVAPAPARREAAQRAAQIIVPRVDIYETPDRFVLLLADMPGVAQDGLDVVAERDSLTVHGRVVPPDVVPEYSEFELGDYHRVFRLTDYLDTDDIRATLHDGVLRVEIKKSQRVQPRKIPVRAE